MKMFINEEIKKNFALAVLLLNCITFISINWSTTFLTPVDEVAISMLNQLIQYNQIKLIKW